jgi:anti-sigma regulatory factor (Ser/Thr protein kinase)
MSSCPKSRQHGHVEFAHHQWLADPLQLRRIRATVRDWLSLVDLADDARDDLVCAVNGAASNAFEHAYSGAAMEEVLDVTFWTERNRVWIEVVDHGRWKIPTPPPVFRGCGIAMMERLVDTVLIHYDRGGTSVLLGQRRAGRTGQLLDVSSQRLPLHGWDTDRCA